MKRQTNILVLLSCLGFLCSTDAAISAWINPNIASASDGPGTLEVAEDQAKDVTITTYEATGSGTTVTYSLVTPVAPFALSEGGVLTITDNLDFETTSTYTLEVKAEDDADPVGSGTATITVTVTDVNEAPIFASSALGSTIRDGSKSGDEVTTVTATDQDSGDTITYSIKSGNTNDDFAIGPSTGVITVANTIDKDTTSVYNLEIEATDDDDSPLSGSMSLYIVVTDSGATGLFCGIALTLLAGLLSSLQ